MQLLDDSFQLQYQGFKYYSMHQEREQHIQIPYQNVYLLMRYSYLSEQFFINSQKQDSNSKISTEILNDKSLKKYICWFENVGLKYAIQYTNTERDI